MTEETRARVPQHLSKYVVSQNYARYSPEDQAVWRFILRQLKDYLSVHAHKVYAEGLSKTGISIDRIPRIEEIDQKLQKFGWGAVPVSGFIPPAAFMEFQALGVLPIACDMRTLAHTLYTPAPDIVHEAAGHAPILMESEYADYIKQYGAVARRSILSREDLEQYEAIRVLSDLKENPVSSKAAIATAEKRLNQVSAAMSFVSEAALLSRMNWWTSEYGLIGPLNSPKIFGAGLLSSVSESRACLSAKVQKLPLSVDCVNYAYDITEQQPQLFVAQDFAQLGEILEQLSDRLAFRRGGVFGLERAVEARSVTTTVLNSGLQISGQLASFESTERPLNATFLKYTGPVQLAYGGVELEKQGTAHHAQGFSSPLGMLANHRRCLSTYTVDDLHNMALRQGERARLKFESGIRVEGVLHDWLFRDGKLILLSWKDCTVTREDEVLFRPDWGDFDMAVGSTVDSVFGGPADRERFGQTDDFVASQIPAREYSPAERARHNFYTRLRSARENGNSLDFSPLMTAYLKEPGADWLQGIELLELSYLLGLDDTARKELRERLDPENFADTDERRCVEDGLRLAGAKL